MIRIVAPASLSNLGPGFDRLGVAISGWSDLLHARQRQDGQITLELTGPLSGAFPIEPEANVATIAAARFSELVGYDGGMHLILEKGIPPGSGLGGSAASAAAGACAAAIVSDRRGHIEQIVEAALFAENIASGGTHPDNVTPCLFGGLVEAAVVSDTVSIQSPLGKFEPLGFVVVKPDSVVLTKTMRSILPEYSAGAQARNSARTRQLLNALDDRRLSDAGKWMMTDEYAEPLRTPYVSYFSDWKQLLLNAGALGYGLSGSGPAMFALCASAESAHNICEEVDGFKEDCTVKAVRTLATGALHGVQSSDILGRRLQFKMSS